MNFKVAFCYSAKSKDFQEHRRPKAFSLKICCKFSKFKNETFVKAKGGEVSSAVA